jgi:hypothetical protein
MGYMAILLCHVRTIGNRVQSTGTGAQTTDHLSLFVLVLLKAGKNPIFSTNNIRFLVFGAETNPSE